LEGIEMAWLKLMKHDGSRILVNTDEVSEVHWITNSSGDGFGAAIWSHGEATGVDESAEEVAAMIERDVWRERVLRVACAIMANEHAARLTSEQVWALAVHVAAIDPERPQGGGDK
jgi:hypothetical protein